MFTDTGYDKVQSRHVCYPMHVHIAKDNREFYATELTPLYSDINDLEDAHEGGLKFGHPQDLYSHQKCLGVGGAMKNKTYACHLCNIHKDDLNKVNDVACDDCIRLGRRHEGAPTPCYHQTVSDEQLLAGLQQEREALLLQYAHLAVLPLRQSKMRCGNGGINDNRSDM
jgi:hypothetical protein